MEGKLCWPFIQQSVVMGFRFVENESVGTSNPQKSKK